MNSPGLGLGGHGAERQCPRHTKGVAGAGQTVVPPGRRLGPRRMGDVLYTLGALWNFAGLRDCRPSRRAPRANVWGGARASPASSPWICHTSLLPLQPAYPTPSLPRREGGSDLWAEAAVPGVPTSGKDNGPGDPAQRPPPSRPCRGLRSSPCP